MLDKAIEESTTAAETTRFDSAGEELESSTVLRVLDPEDGSLITTLSRATAGDVDNALARAVFARDVAFNLSSYQRTDILRRTADLVEARQSDFAWTIAKEGIKTIREAKKEVGRCVHTLRLSADEASQLHGQTIPFDRRADAQNRTGYYMREPVGIIAAITSFNDPLNLVAHKAGPAIAAGNAILVKPHEETPLSALLLARTLREAGLPDGICQVLVGGADVGSLLVKDERVRMISFTGGRATGEAIIREAGLKKVTMELGGNCATIVMSDADLHQAVPACVTGAFAAAGQNCLHVQRILVHAAVYKEFASKFIMAAQKLKLGKKLHSSTDIGPLINEPAAIRVEKLVANALASGAQLLLGGKREGAFYAPTVLENVVSSSPLYQEEIFGPVTMLEPITDLDDGIRKSNQVSYGLQAAIFTRDLNCAFAAIRRLSCGSVIVNDSTDYRDDGMPFGGVKGSGIGREGVPFALLEMTEPKVACFNF